MALKWYQDPDGRDPFLRDAFRHVLAQTTIGLSLRSDLEEAWVRDQILERGKNALNILAPLKTSYWAWEDFETIRQIFRQNDTWPSPWLQCKKAASDPDNPRHTQRIKILATSLQTALASRESARGKKYERIAQHGWSIRCKSDAARPFVDHFSKNIKVLDWRTWPPFYPGDTSRIIAVTRSRTPFR